MTGAAVWLCGQANFDSANQTLQCLSSRSFPANDVDTLWTQWYDFFMTTISQSIPSKIVKPRRKLPYLTDNLQRALKRKLKLFQEAKKLDTERAWSKYSKARNKATTALQSAKSNFFKSLSIRLKSPKDFWAIYHKLSPKDGIPTDLKLDNTTARTSRAKANLLNIFFSSCFSPSSRLSAPDLQPTTVGPRLSSVTCSVEEVHQLLSTHKLHTASGPDSISCQMLRATASSICHAITYIFNESLAQAKMPASWKTAYVTPIPKPGDPSAATTTQSHFSCLYPRFLKESFTPEFQSSYMPMVSFLTVSSALGPALQPKKPSYMSPTPGTTN